MTTIDLNADLGESFGPYTLGLDEEILPIVSSANIACGFHASDPLTMKKTVQLAKKHQVAIGAHPGLPDLVGFGRRTMAIAPEEAKALVQYQVGALQAFVGEEKLHHVKPHGALYNMASKDKTLARAICQGIQEVDAGLVLYGLSGSELIQVAKEMGLPYAQEAFIDRNIESDGTLTPRSEPDAVLSDEETVVQRTIQMIQNKTVESRQGEVVDLEADTLCLHGDNPHAVAFAKRIRQALDEYGIHVRTL